MSQERTIVAVVALYFLAMLAVGWRVRSKNRSAEEYFLAGKSLPHWVVALSMAATGESAWLLLGLSGLAYAVGVHALWVVAGETLGIWLSWTFVARRLNRAAHECRAVTITDLLASRVADPGSVLRLTAAAITLSMVVVYLSAQMLATGKAFQTFLGWPYAFGVVIGGAVTILYTAVGGFRAVAYTDTVQALFMLFAVLAVPIAGLIAAGGPQELAARLVAADASLLSPWGASPTATVAVIAVASALAIGLPFAGAPQLLVRFMAARSVEDIPKAARISVAVILLFDLGAVATGLIGRTLFGDLQDAEGIMPHMSRTLFPPIVTGILVVAVLSAIMSTVSSLLNLASSAAVRDFYQQSLRPQASPQHVARVGAWMTLCLGALGCWIALEQPGQIFTLVLFASGGLGVTFGPAVVCLLWGVPVTRAGVLTGMIGGILALVGWVLLFKDRFHGLYEVIPGLVAGFALVLFVSSRTRPGARAVPVRSRDVPVARE